ncbi:MAG: RnfABCDGE type electron transport complex subunit D, partial [Planctomycetota bacterium]
LLGLTLPADVPWYVPLVAAAFATTLGKAIFGGVGHFLWQPALVGRLAVTVIFPALLTGADGPILARNQLVRGDIRQVQAVQRLRDWPDQLPPAGYDGFVVEKPQQTLRLLYDSQRPRFSGIAYVGDGLERPEPPLLSRLPSVRRMMYGVRPGPMGGTCAVLILVAGVYLMYRNYVKPHLPLSFLLAAAVVAAIAPIHLVGHDGATRTVWYPFLYEGLAEGCVFLIYHLTSGGMLLAAFLLATEMTSRPVTRGGQVIFGLLGGALAMVLRICTRVPVPVFMAVLAVNTLTPLIDALWRPRVMGQSWLARFRLG